MSYHLGFRSWPKCQRCSDRLGRAYPVETLELQESEGSTLISSSHRLVFAVECHGDKQRHALEIPPRFFPANKLQALSYVWCFIPGTTAPDFRATRKTGALTTEVR